MLMKLSKHFMKVLSTEHKTGKQKATLCTPTAMKCFRGQHNFWVKCKTDLIILHFFSGSNLIALHFGICLHLTFLIVSIFVCWNRM